MNEQASEIIIEMVQNRTQSSILHTSEISEGLWKDLK